MCTQLILQVNTKSERNNQELTSSDQSKSLLVILAIGKVLEGKMKEFPQTVIFTLT